MTRSSRLARRVLQVVVAGSLAGAAGGVLLGMSNSSASTLGGTATIVNQSSPANGGSANLFSVQLPGGAECTGDTASDGYHEFSYLIPRVAISQPSFATTLNYKGPPAGYASQGLGLVEKSTEDVWEGKSTAPTTGEVIGIPADFQWSQLITQDYYPLTGSGGLLYNNNTSGIWEAGIACANSSGVISDYWNTEVTFTSSNSDTNGFTWTAVAGLGTWQAATQTITFTSTAPSNATAGGATYGASATGGASGNAVTFKSDTASTCSVSGSTVSFVAIGTCTVEADQAGNNSYAPGSNQQSFTVGQGAQVIHFTSTAPSHATVGGATYAVSATGGASGNAVTFKSDTASTCSVSGSTVSFVAIGTCTVEADQAGNASYTAATAAKQTFSVSASVGPCGNVAVTQCITSSDTTTATVGQSFTFTVATSGTPTPKVKGKGHLPKGVKFHNGAGTATLSGTPTSTKHKSAAGTFQVTITATFGKGSSKNVVNQTLTLTVGS